MLVAQGLGEPLRLAQVREDAVILQPLPESMAQAKADIDRLLVARATLGEMLHGYQRLLEARHRLPTGRACHRLVARLAAVGDGLVPHLAPQGMVRQPFDLIGQAVAIRASRWPPQCRAWRVRRRSWRMVPYATSCVRACLKV